MENFLLSNVDSFILNTVYYTENKTNCVEIGLNQYDEYTPSIRLGAVQHSYSCISNNFKFIDNYKYYARVIHSKIVNYFIIQISKGRLTDNMLSFQTLRSMLISLKSEVLPKGPIECNFEHFNIPICHMIDAEIRAHSPSIIFKNVSNVLTNLQHYYTRNQWWWWWN